MHILVVDDNRDAAESLGAILEMLGHEVVLAFDGVAGVEAASRLRPDLVFMDIAMPRLTGHRAAQIIRASVPRTSLVAISGFATKADVDEALRHGFHAHLPKPVDFASLSTVLQERQPPAHCHHGPSA